MDIIPVWNPQELLTQPMFAPLHDAINKLDVSHFPERDELNAVLQAHAVTTRDGHPLRLVKQTQGKSAFEAQYEPRCYLTGEVQHRADNWHDLFNALVWLTFPRAKAVLNARHYAALLKATPSNGSQRGAARDVGTLLDESGVIVPYCDAALAGLLRKFQWHELFWQNRVVLRQRMDFYLFGHGLYEKALKPYIGLTGQGLLLQVEPAFFNWPQAQRLAHLDEQMAAYLADENNCHTTRELTPVPLLGVPGWSEENESEVFYGNKAYFREGRRSG
jgi:hypothetical protein